MAVLAQLFSFQSVTLIAAVEWFLAIKVLPGYYDTQKTHLATAGVVFAVNYAFYGLFWLLLYPRLLSPLRHLPGPRVSLPFVALRDVIANAASRRPSALSTEISWKPRDLLETCS